MEEANLKTEVIKSKMDFESQVEFLEKYIDKIKKASAIFVQQDVPAISIIQELKTTYGINVPEDISII
ncbi:LacI family transcriptional regulator, partial [Clostridioides difficile]|nr:LacI family transcriptional regulator [Clostridioides difficile]